MKKYILFIGILFLSVQFSTAQNLLQGDVTPEVQKKINDRVRFLKKKLALSAKQAALVNKKLSEYAIAKRKIVQAKLGKEEQDRKLQALRKNNMKDMHDIMHNQQYRTYKSMETERLTKKKKTDKNKGEMSKGKKA